MVIPIRSAFVCSCLYESKWRWLWLIVLLFINSNHPQHISFYIESLWFEYELCVISDNLSFNISCFRYHSISYIIYTLHTLYQYLLFTSTDSTVFTISERWYRDEWMNDKRSVWMMCIGSLLIDVKKELRSNDELLRLLKCMKHCETIWIGCNDFND